MIVGAPTIWTIGHGSIEIEQLTTLLGGQAIRTLADVRSAPYSKFAPQFNREVLATAVQRGNIQYAFWGDTLGGRPNHPSLFLRGGKPDYHAMAETAEFARGLELAIDAARRERICLMCSEEDPAYCHRSRLVAEQLVKAGFVVLNIRHDGSVESHADVVRRRTGGQLALF